MRGDRTRAALLTGALCAAAALAPHPAIAQGARTSGAVALPPFHGIVETAEARAEAGTRLRVLVIGAHPDDEDTGLIAWLARGHRARTAYLSLTRGDGGQNLIGNELGEALGVIRTEELLAARRIDGAHQYFTRAYDFGFSKTAAESFAHWPHDSLLGDVIKVVRAVRPDVVVSVFSGTPRDGHGQHQVAGILAREAYDLAADTVRFPARTYGAPWLPGKFYRGARFWPETATLAIDIGAYDPILGRSYAEIAAESRSQHKSQGFGTTAPRGVVMDYLRREATRVNAATPATRERSLFDGLDTARVTSPADREAIALAAAQVAVNATAPRARVALGDSVPVRVAVYERGVLDSASSRTVYLHGDAITQPYWLRRPRVGDLFAAASDSISDDARERSHWLVVPVRVPGRVAPIMVRVPATYRYADPVRGAVRRPVVVAPGVSVTFARDVELARAGAAIDRPYEVTLRSSWADTDRVTVRLQLPAGVRADSAARTVTLAPGATRTVTFRVRGALAAGDHHVRAVAQDARGRYTMGFIPIEYPHITPERMYRPADVLVRAVAVTIPAGVRVGYVPGVGDNIPAALADLGIPVTLLDPATIPTTDLSRFTTIVTGPRAYEASPALVHSAPALLAYVRRGGNLVSQYAGQRPIDRPGVMPYPVTFTRPAARVTLEDAPVTIVDPASPLLTTPNRITARDFAGWVQERSTYMPSGFDPRYRTVIAMHDPGEPSDSAAILTTPYGSGRYTYVTLALFRQLPAAVPGAVRLFANLLR